MVRVKAIHRITKKTWISEPMPIQDAIIWIEESSDVYCHCDYEIVTEG